MSPTTTPAPRHACSSCKTRQTALVVLFVCLPSAQEHSSLRRPALMDSEHSSRLLFSACSQPERQQSSDQVRSVAARVQATRDTLVSALFARWQQQGCTHSFYWALRSSADIRCSYKRCIIAYEHLCSDLEQVAASVRPSKLNLSALKLSKGTYDTAKTKALHTLGRCCFQPSSLNMSRARLQA